MRPKALPIMAVARMLPFAPVCYPKPPFAPLTSK